MNLIVGVLFMALVALTVRSNSPSTPLSSLCVLDEAHVCWIDKAGGIKREVQPGDYVLSPEDMNRIIEKLKSVQ